MAFDSKHLRAGFQKNLKRIHSISSSGPSTRPAAYGSMDKLKNDLHSSKSIVYAKLEFEFLCYCYKRASSTLFDGQPAKKGWFAISG